MIRDLSPGDLSGRLAGPGLVIRTGPFHVRLRSDIPSIAQGLARLYPDVPLADTDGFCDHDVEIRRSHGLRRWLRPQARFVMDGSQSFAPLPLGQAFPLLEWAMNWCISTQAHHYLLLHAAVLERGGRAVILPAPPGSGKSTLCAALAFRGWRLLSDELALVDLQQPLVHALARPISLKNASIDIIRRFAPDAVVNTPTPGTAKGTVTHVRPPPEAVARVDEPAVPAWVVLPRWQAGAPAQLTARPKAPMVVELARNSFNYGLLGPAGFQRMVQLVDACACHDFVYGELSDAMAVFDELAGTPA